MKKTGIALGVLLAAGAVCTGGAWYTAGQLEGALQGAISEGNRQLQTSMPGSGLALELVSLERGLFSSTARYRLRLDKPGDEEPAAELRFVDHIEHGPLPLSRLASLRWLPVMATSRVELERNADVEPWFAAAGAAVPLRGTFAIGYGGGVDGQLQLAPLQVVAEGEKLDFSGLDLDFAVGADAKDIRLSGAVERLSLDLQHERGPVRISLNGLSLDSERSRGRSTLYMGESRLALASSEIRLADQPPLLIRDLVQSDSLHEQGERIAASLAYDVGGLSYDGHELGSARLQLSLGNLDMTALRQLSELYTRYAMRLQGEDDFELSAEEETRLRDALLQLLAGQPRLALDEWRVKTASGESRFTLQLDLDRPQQLEASPDALARQLIQRLQASLVVGKPMIRDLLMLQAIFDPQADRAALSQEAEQAAQMAGEMASGLQLARLEGENIVARLDYRDGQVEFNGASMPVEQFAAQMMGMAALGGDAFGSQPGALQE